MSIDKVIEILVSRRNLKEGLIGEEQGFPKFETTNQENGLNEVF